MAEKNGLTQYAMRAGLVLGLFWVFRYLLFMLGSGNFLINGIHTLLMPFTLILAYLFTVRYRMSLGGSISFGKAWRLGVMTYFFAALIVSIPHYIYYQYVNPTYLSDAIDMAKELLSGIELSPESAEVINNMEAPVPILMTFYDIISNIFYGMIFSVPIALIASLGGSSSPTAGYNESQNQD